MSAIIPVVATARRGPVPRLAPGCPAQAATANAKAAPAAARRVGMANKCSSMVEMVNEAGLKGKIGGSAARRLGGSAARRG
jgi:hypothetical protein